METHPASGSRARGQCDGPRLEIKTPDELVDAELEARWAVRRGHRLSEVLHRVWWAFLERGGPIGGDEIVAAMPGWPHDSVLAGLTELDEADLLWLRGGRVEVAYPFSAAPTAFVVRLADGRERYACCAIDALGLAPMLGQPIRVLSACHHCEEPVDLDVDPAGPATGAEGVMVWVGRRGPGERRVGTSL